MVVNYFKLVILLACYNITCNHILYILSFSMQVTVIITDINDHPPLFDKALFNFTLPEDEAIDTLLGQVKASDVDTKTEMLTYQLVSGNEDGKQSCDNHMHTPLRLTLHTHPVSSMYLVDLYVIVSSF